MADLAVLKELLKLAKYIKHEGLDFSIQIGFCPIDFLPCSLDSWCLGHPPFVKLGLRRMETRMVARNVRNTTVPVYGPKGFEGKEELICNDALCAFFDIDYDDSKFIFGTWREIRELNHKHAYTTKPINRLIANDIDFQIERVEIIMEKYFPGWDEEK